MAHKVLTQGFSTFLRRRRAHQHTLTRETTLLRCYLNPFNLLLTALAALSLVSADVKAMLVIGVMVALSTVTRFVQEGRSHRSATAC